MKKKKKYDLYIKEKLKIRDYIIIIIYLLLNVIPPLFLKNSAQIGAYFILISLTSTIIFATDYLKSTRNIFLAITWLILYGFVCFYHTNLLLNTFTVDDGNLLKIVRLPIVSYVYLLIFRMLFVSTYRYEPSIYWQEELRHNLFGKNIKHREDCIWFVFGRLLMLFVIMYVVGAI